jgi:hypothetical protein
VDTKKIKKWIRTIALWHLICAVINVALFILPYLTTIQGKLTLHDYVQAFINTIGGLAIFLGLWRLSPWGWKIAVLFIPISWGYVSYDLFVDYRHGVGLLLSPFIFIDCLILLFLFKEHVREIFKISSPNWIKLSWLVGPLLIFAVFLLIHDVVNDIIAFVLALVILMGFHTANKYRRKPQSS